MGIVHCHVSLPEVFASNKFKKKQKIFPQFFLVPEPCHKRSSGSCRVEFMFLRRKAIGKKHEGQVSKQNRKDMRGPFLVAKAKWSSARAGFCPSTAAIRDIPQSIFTCTGLHFPTSNTGLYC